MVNGQLAAHTLCPNADEAPAVLHCKDSRVLVGVNAVRLYQSPASGGFPI
jgi:hypothetical protein